MYSQEHHYTNNKYEETSEIGDTTASQNVSTFVYLQVSYWVGIVKIVIRLCVLHRQSNGTPIRWIGCKRILDEIAFESNNQFFPSSKHTSYLS